MRFGVFPSTACLSKNAWKRARTVLTLTLLQLNAVEIYRKARAFWSRQPTTATHLDDRYTHWEWSLLLVCRHARS